MRYTYAYIRMRSRESRNTPSPQCVRYFPRRTCVIFGKFDSFDRDRFVVTIAIMTCPSGCDSKTRNRYIVHAYRVLTEITPGSVTYRAVYIYIYIHSTIYSCTFYITCRYPLENTHDNRRLPFRHSVDKRNRTFVMGVRAFEDKNDSLSKGGKHNYSRSN